MRDSISFSKNGKKVEVKVGMRVRIIKLCNYEEFYGPGDEGTVLYIDDADQIHVKWDNKGSIALLPEDEFEVVN